MQTKNYKFHLTFYRFFVNNLVENLYNFRRKKMSQLIHNAMQSTPQGFVGVGLIFFYFVVMVAAIIYRIKKGEHLDH